MRKINYDINYCKEVAIKYNNKTEFKKNSISIYNFARKNNWLNLICSHMQQIIKPNYYWNYINCKNEALKYSTKNNFHKYSSSAYSSARINGWLDDICSHMIFHSKPRGYWTYDKCKEIALKYKTKKEFLNNDNIAYKMAHRKGWIDKICIHMEILGNKYNRCIYAYEFPDNHVYVGLTLNLNERNENRKKNKNDQVIKHIKETNLNPKLIKLTKYIPINEASKLEIYYVDYYKNNGWIILNKMKAGGLGGSNIIWTYDKLIEIAKKYNNYSKFRIENNGAYDAAKRNKWCNDIISIINNNEKHV